MIIYKGVNMWWRSMYNTSTEYTYLWQQTHSRVDGNGTANGDYKWRR